MYRESRLCLVRGRRIFCLQLGEKKRIKRRCFVCLVYFLSLAPFVPAPASSSSSHIDRFAQRSPSRGISLIRNERDLCLYLLFWNIPPHLCVLLLLSCVRVSFHIFHASAGASLVSSNFFTKKIEKKKRCRKSLQHVPSWKK